jgi:ADP-sugar diphosphatase
MIVQPSDATGDDEKHVIFTVRPRIGASSLAFTEIPAQVLDGIPLKGSAAIRIAEVAKLTIEGSDLINMSEIGLEGVEPSDLVEEAMYPSPGTCDEYISLLLCQKRVTRKHMEWLKGKATGRKYDGGIISLKLVPLNKAWKEGGRDGKTLAALALYQGLKGEGKIPEMPNKVEKEPEDMN